MFFGLSDYYFCTMDHEKDLLLEKLFDHFIIICLLYSFIPYNQIGIPKIDAKQETGIGSVCLSNMTQSVEFTWTSVSTSTASQSILTSSSPPPSSSPQSISTGASSSTLDRSTRSRSKSISTFASSFLTSLALSSSSSPKSSLGSSIESGASPYVHSYVVTVPRSIRN